MHKNAPVVYRSSEEIREIIIDWVERDKAVPTKPTTTGASFRNEFVN
jgi:hypothetical protein